MQSVLIHCILVDSSTVICWMSSFVILGCQVYFETSILFLMKILLANIVDPDQMPHFMVSDVGLHCLPMTLYRFPGNNRLVSKYCNMYYTVRLQNHPALFLAL